MERPAWVICGWRIGRAEELTGWPLDEAKSRPCEAIFQIINEESRQIVESPVIKVIREGLIVGLANHTVLVRRDGSEIPIDDSVAPIREATGDSRPHAISLPLPTVLGRVRGLRFHPISLA
jgi:PAS domain S-box-containing protein